MKIDFSSISRYCQISYDGLTNPIDEIRGQDLLHNEKLNHFLTNVKKLYKANDFLLPVSFTGTILFDLFTAQIVILSKYKCILDLQLQSFSVQLGLYNGIYPYLHIKLNETKCVERPSCIESYFSNFLLTMFVTPVNKIAAMANVKPTLIYNQLGSKFSSTKELFFEHEAVKSDRDEFSNILQKLPKNIIPTRRNPFDYTPVYIESPYEPGKQVIVRSSCCMFYVKENGAKCFNCPSLSNEDRQNSFYK